MNIPVNLPITYIDTNWPPLTLNKNTQKLKPFTTASVQECVDEQTKSSKHDMHTHNNLWPQIVIGEKLWNPNIYMQLLSGKMAQKMSCTRFFVLNNVDIILLISWITTLYSEALLSLHRSWVSLTKEIGEG